ncbi:hypothetical protein DFH09DRAFT_1155524 [Mycena vulgaris]|nr:hypothetical protein DFH09DRAFT_1155524 [Mycena vulgaris]
MPTPTSRNSNRSSQAYPLPSPADAGHGWARTKISYESPKLVKSQIKAWTTTVQSAAVVTTLFSGTSAQLLSVIRADTAVKMSTMPQMGTADAARPVMILLLVASYAAILFNVIATLGSLFLIDRIGDIDLNEARKGGDRITDGFIDRMVYLFLGIMSIFLQTLTYIWLHEGRVTSIIITALTGSAIAGLFFTSGCMKGE